MESPISLATVAEIAAALAGFAALAGILRRDYTDRHIALGGVEMSLIAVAFSLLPSVIGELRVTAMLFVAVWSTAAASATRRQRKATGQVFLDETPLISILLLMLVFTAIALGVLVVLAIYPDHAPRLYTSAIVCVVLASCLTLWRTVRQIIFPPGPSGSE